MMRDRSRSTAVMAGLVPATHAYLASPVFMGPRHKAGDDELNDGGEA
jgi:hypothetical protein